MRTSGKTVLVGALAGVAMGSTAPAPAQSPSPSAAPEVRLDIPAPPVAADSASALAEKLQNPIGNIISVPFQNNVNFNSGRNKGTQDILNIQPVVPLSIGENWNVITRTILPVVWNPTLQPAHSVPAGLAPTTFSAFLSPGKPVNGWVWGAGPIVQVPTITSKTLGSNVWGAGPSIVVVRTDTPWVYGVLANNVFSAGGTPGFRGTQYSKFTVNPFVNYNFAGGWFVGTVPIITANWYAGGTKWTLPVGAQAGRLIKIGGKLPVALLAGVYYNFVRPEYGSNWQLRMQIALAF